MFRKYCDMKHTHSSMQNSNAIRLLKERIDQKSIDDSFLVSFYHEYLPVPVYLPIVMTDKLIIARIRKNNKENGVFSKVSDVSYPPANKARADRANVLGEPIFYGTLLESMTDEQGVATSVEEAASDFFNFDVGESVILTLSLWKVTDSFYTCALPMPETFSKKHLLANEIYEKWSSKKQDFPEDETSLIEYVGKIMSEKGDEAIYKATAQFVKHVLSTHPDLKGVIYPSVKFNGQGVCAAILPSTVNKCMSCYETQMLLCSRKEGNITNSKTIATARVENIKSLNWTYLDAWSEEKVTAVINNSK